MPDEDILIGYSVTPETRAAARLTAAVERADAAGLDLVGIQDHPYQSRFLDTLALIGVLLAKTERITIFPNVANLPLRPPAVLAKQAATLDLLSGGRFELGLGAGAFWDAISAFGGVRLTPGESVDALSEAIAIIRALWSSERPVSAGGTHHRVAGAVFGPRPERAIGIWLGAYKPRMLQLTGSRADGWIPSYGRLTREQLREASARVDEAASAAGRDPRAVRRLLNISGEITVPGAGDTSGGDGSPAGPPAFWVELLSELRAEGFSAFVFWPTDDTDAQIDRLAYEIAPALRTS